MPGNLIPMRWPTAWKDAAPLRGTPINCILGAAAAPPAGVTALQKPPETVRLLEGDWARVRSSQRGSGGAGPTGKPWIDSNGWRLLLDQALHPAGEFWVTAEPPKAEVLRPEAYELMVADVEAHGARWVVSLDDALAKSLSEKPSALAWDRVTAALRFFAGHRAWSTYSTVATTAVISDFAGDNEFLGHELLNLAARRLLPLRILPKARAASMDWTGLSALVLIEATEPSAQGPLLDKLIKFVEGGGTLIAPARLLDGRQSEARFEYDAWSRGKGHLFVPRQAWTDPYLLAADVHLLVGREHDVIRIYNATSANVRYAESPDGRRGVVHMLHYAARGPANDVSLALRKPWKSARILTPDRPEPQPLAVKKSRYGVDIPLPPIAVYAAIELEAS